MGTVVAMPLSGYLISSNIFGGWPSVFYVSIKFKKYAKL